MIVPMALVSTQRMKVVQQLIEQRGAAWYSNFAWRPGKLFDTVNRALTIFVVSPSSQFIGTTGYQKWTSDTRSHLLSLMYYEGVTVKRDVFWVPKLSAGVEVAMLAKMVTQKNILASKISRMGANIYYRCGGGLYWKVFTDFAPKFRLNGKAGHSSRETSFRVPSELGKTTIALLSSNTFWWWYTLTSNLRDLNPYDVQSFPVPESAFTDQQIADLGVKYLESIDRNSTMQVREQKKTGRTETQSFKIQLSKPIIDEIDTVLAKHYGFTDEELDFIINYDIKYRMGRDAESEEE